MEKKLMIDSKIRKFAENCNLELETFHSMKLYSYDYIRNFAPEMFKNTKYYILDSCRYYITAKETSCFTEFSRNCFGDDVTIITIDGRMSVINNLDVLKEIVEVMHTKGGLR